MLHVQEMSDRDRLLSHSLKVTALLCVPKSDGSFESIMGSSSGLYIDRAHERNKKGRGEGVGGLEFVGKKQGDKGEAWKTAGEFCAANTEKR